MANVTIFNTSAVSLMFSVNGGDYIAVNGTSNTIGWTPLSPNTSPPFVNNTTPDKGQLGLGQNNLTMYPKTSGTRNSATVQIDIPTKTIVSSVQLYFAWKDAKHVGVVSCNGGQFLQAVSLN